jgi:alpha-L-fucosidase
MEHTLNFEPTLESLRQHEVPAWFHDAKLGIFIHWGPYSVPGWAPRRKVDFTAPDWNAENAYAEWYLNTLTIGGNSTERYHRETFGDGYSYDNFGATLQEAMRGWEPARWAGLFAAAGARYVVPGTKHHDGFLMWPSAHPNPFKQQWQMERDVIGDLAREVRERGMRLGLYYSGGLDWTFGGLPIYSGAALMSAVPQSAEYGAYADAHWRELIARYQPDVLWNDIAYPSTGDFNAIFAEYYNARPDGVVNNRFDMIGALQGRVHFDFFTPEYEASTKKRTKKWEACRGIGNSFGYNRNESDEDYASAADLIWSLADIVSKNGNLLLNVGPTASGEIPWPQEERLLALGAWLRVNGDAIYGTRPRLLAEAVTVEGLEVRFTTKADVVYVIVRAPTDVPALTVPDSEASSAVLLGYSAPLLCERVADGLRITLPMGFETSPAVVLRLQ